MLFANITMDEWLNEFICEKPEVCDTDSSRYPYKVSCEMYAKLQDLII
jgi:hypothetical protein